MSIMQHVSIAFLFRIVFLIYGEYHDNYFSVKYTDIDYYVFTDAAELINDGLSPFDRQTYRYTPFLAFLLWPSIVLHFAFGKILFAVLDVLTGYLIFTILQHYGHDLKISKWSAFLWWYNPMAVVIATRGSSESVMTSLIMLSILLLQRNQRMYLGLVYGFSVHFKIYSIIYALAFYIFTSEPHIEKNLSQKFFLMFYPCRKRVKFAFFATVGFLVPTVLSYYWYGTDYIYEAFLYHITRRDVKHNFSPYFYLTYLSELSDSKVEFGMLKLNFFFQLILLIVVTVVFSLTKELPACMFVQTFIFVTFNKVCTSQYFLWYLCLLPLNFPLLHSHSVTFRGIVLWLFAQAVWLLPAYCLEFQGFNVFHYLWVASLIMFGINICIICAFCKIRMSCSMYQEFHVIKIKKQ